MSFIVEDPEAQPEPLEEPRKAVGVDAELTRLATLSDRWGFIKNTKPLERSLDKIRGATKNSIKEEAPFEELAQS